MANYYGTGRSNYFRVKDVEEFTKWAEGLSLEVITKTAKNDETLVGFIASSEDGDIPSVRLVEGSLAEDEFGEADYQDVDFLEELSHHLIDGEVAVFIHAGAEKARYVVGHAVAVNSKGQVKSVSVNSIYDLAKELGNNITAAEY